MSDLDIVLTEIKQMKSTLEIHDDDISGVGFTLFDN